MAVTSERNPSDQDTESSADPEECNESEDEEENNGESAGKQVVHPRKPEKISVKWSKADTAIIGEAFRDFIYNEKEKKNCSGSLASKGKLITFLRETQLESLSMLPEKGQYLKTRAKVFNERKTAREKSCQAMKKMAAGKTK